MNFKTTLVLLILLLGAGVAIYFTKDRPADPAAETKDGKKLLSITAADVQTVTIRPADGKTIVARRNGVDWTLAEPVNGPADAGRVNALLADLVGLESQTSVEVSEGSGLKSPRFVVELGMNDGKTHSLHIGDRSGVGDRLYVQLKGNARADLVAAGVDEQLEKPLDELRDKKLVSLSSDQVKYLAIDRPEGKLELLNDNGDWKITNPQAMKADDSAVNDLLFAVTRLRATEFVAGEPNAPLYGLGDGARKVTLATAAPAGSTRPATQPSSVTLVFGRPDTVLQQNLFATVAGSGGVVKVAKTSTDFLDRKPIELRDKQVVDVDPASVGILSVVIDSPATTQPTTKPAENQQYVVRRRPPAATQPTTQAATQPTSQPAPTTWSSLSGEDANDAAVTAILTALHPLRAERYVETAPAGGKTIAVKLETGGGGVRVSGHTEIKFVVPADGQPPVGVYNGLSFEVSRALVDRLQTDFTKPGPAPTPAAPMPDMGDMMP